MTAADLYGLLPRCSIFLGSFFKQQTDLFRITIENIVLFLIASRTIVTALPVVTVPSIKSNVTPTLTNINISPHHVMKFDCNSMLRFWIRKTHQNSLVSASRPVTSLVYDSITSIKNGSFKGRHYQFVGGGGGVSDVERSSSFGY